MKNSIEKIIKLMKEKNVQFKQPISFKSDLEIDYNYIKKCATNNYCNDFLWCIRDHGTVLLPIIGGFVLNIAKYYVHKNNANFFIINVYQETLKQINNKKVIMYYDKSINKEVVNKYLIQNNPCLVFNKVIERGEFLNLWGVFNDHKCNLHNYNNALKYFNEQNNRSMINFIKLCMKYDQNFDHCIN